MNLEKFHHFCFSLPLRLANVYPPKQLQEPTMCLSFKYHLLFLRLQSYYAQIPGIKPGTVGVLDGLAAIVGSSDGDSVGDTFVGYTDVVG